jgi:predicted DNA-binding transcriptional regulator YafY
MHRTSAEHARQRIHVDTTGWDRSNESIEFLPLLQEAVWAERKLKFSYQRGGGCDAVERLADPLGLVAKGSAWYLVANVGGETRSYRVSRLIDVKLMDEPCDRPREFDLAAYWDQSTVDFKANLPKYFATVRAHPDVFPRLRFAGRFARIGKADPPDADGWIRVDVRFDVEEMAIEWTLGFGAKMEVLEPAPLREKVIEAARSALAFYAK